MPDEPQENTKATPRQEEVDNQPSAAGASKPADVSADELAELRKRAGERDEYLQLLQRTQADFQNYQKRTRRERDEERQYYAGAVLAEMLPVLDNLERTLAAAEQANESGALVQGVKMVQAQFLELMKKHGVAPIEAEGRPFDPNLHEALTQQPSAEHPANTVMHVAATGYKVHERVLRPARVVVSSGHPE